MSNLQTIVNAISFCHYSINMLYIKRNCHIYPDMKQVQVQNITQMSYFKRNGKNEENKKKTQIVACSHCDFGFQIYLLSPAAQHFNPFFIIVVVTSHMLMWSWLHEGIQSLDIVTHAMYVTISRPNHCARYYDQNGYKCLTLLLIFYW